MLVSRSVFLLHVRFSHGIIFVCSREARRLTYLDGSDALCEDRACFQLIAFNLDVLSPAFQSRRHSKYESQQKGREAEEIFR